MELVLLIKSIPSHLTDTGSTSEFVIITDWFRFLGRHTLWRTAMTLIWISWKLYTLAYSNEICQVFLSDWSYLSSWTSQAVSLVNCKMSDIWDFQSDLLLSSYGRMEKKSDHSTQRISLLTLEHDVVLFDHTIFELNTDDKEYTFQYLLRWFSTQILFYYLTEILLILLYWHFEH